MSEAVFDVSAVRANPVCWRADPPDIGGSVSRGMLSKDVSSSHAGVAIRALGERSPRRIEGRRSVLSALACLPPRTVVASKPRKPNVTCGAKSLREICSSLGSILSRVPELSYIGRRRPLVIIGNMNLTAEPLLSLVLLSTREILIVLLGCLQTPSQNETGMSTINHLQPVTLYFRVACLLLGFRVS